MKKTSFYLAGLTLCLAFFIPLKSWAADTYITSLSVQNALSGSEEIWTIRAGTGFQNSTPIYFAYFNSDSIELANIVFTNASFIPDNFLNGTTTSVSSLDNKAFKLELNSNSDFASCNCNGSLRISAIDIQAANGRTVVPAVTTTDPATITSLSQWTLGEEVTVENDVDDSNKIDSVTAEISNHAVRAMANYEITMTTFLDIETTDQIAVILTRSDAQQSLSDNGNTFSNASFSSDDFSATLSKPGDGLVAFLTPTATMAAGTYTFNLSGATNPSVAGQYVVNLTTGDAEDESTFVASSAVEIKANVVSALAVEADSNTTGVTTNYTFTATTSDDLVAGENLNLVFTAADDNSSIANYDFSNTTLESNNLSGNLLALQQNTILAIILTDTLTAGTVEFTLKNVQNPTSAGSYVAVLTSEDISAESSYAASDEFDILNAPQKPTKLKVKKITARSAVLSWKKSNTATFYKLLLANKKGKKIKLFKNLTVAKKNIKTATKLLQASTTYKFRVRACNEAGCSKWSKYKKFATKKTTKD